MVKHVQSTVVRSTRLHRVGRNSEPPCRDDIEKSSSYEADSAGDADKSGPKGIKNAYLGAGHGSNDGVTVCEKQISLFINYRA